MPRLLILSGKREGDAVDLGTRDLDIGNKRNADLSLRDPWVSFKHGRIGFREGKYFVEDFKSTNGTWINGKRLEAHKPRTLQDGDLIYFGKTKTCFKASGEAKAGESVSNTVVAALEEERDELKRMLDVLERFLDVGADQRDKVIAATSRPEPLVDQAAVEAEREKARTLQEKISQLEQAARDASRKVEDAKGEVDQMKTERDTLAGRLEESQRQASDKISALDFERKNVQQLEAKLLELENRSTTAESELEEARLEAKQFKEALDNAKSQQSDNEQHQTELKHLEERLEQKDKALEELRTESERQRVELTGKCGSAEDKVSELEKQVEELSVQSDNAKAADKKAYDEQITKLEGQITQLTRSIEDREREGKEARERIAELEQSSSQSSGDGDGAELARQLLEAHAKISRLESALQNAGSGGGGDSAALQLTIDRLTSERDLAMAARDAAEEEANGMKADMDQLSMDQIDIEDENERLQERCKELESKLGL